jgi:hypothetical protein
VELRCRRIVLAVEGTTYPAYYPARSASIHSSTMGKLTAKIHDAKSKMHKKAAKNGPAKDSGSHTKESVKEKVKAKKSKLI